MMKNRRSKIGNKFCRLLLALLGPCLGSCGEKAAEEETLSEYVSRCESFTGDRLSDCPEDCELVDAVRILWQGDNTCSMETDDEGVPIREDLCLAADEESASSFGNRGVYRRVEVGETADDPVNPAQPEEVLRLYIHEKMWGWERCTEATSDYCACALQFEDLDG